MQKHYRNDIKKILGIDQSRTASEKILDKVTFNKRPLVNHQKTQNIPTKKIKTIEDTPDSIKQRVFKNIKNLSTLPKQTKAISILRKCLQNQQFQQQVSKQEWLDIVQIITKFDNNINNATISEFRTLMEVTWVCLSEVKQILTKINGQEKVIINQCVFKAIDLQVQLCQLYTDDSFSFIKHFNILALMLKQYFQKQKKKGKQSLQIQKQFIQSQKKGEKQVFIKDQFWTQFPINILIKLLKLPIGCQLETIRPSLAIFFKQFTINYNKILKPEFQAQFFQKYDQFLNTKLKSPKNEQKSYNILGNGGKDQRVSKVFFQAPDETWIKRQ